MSNHWNCYFCNVNDKLSSIRLDLGIRDSVPDSTYPWLLWVWVYFKHPRPDGLSSQEEFDKLVAIEKDLDAQLKRSLQAIFVGCITTDGRREFYFYAPGHEAFEAQVKRVVTDSHGYEFDCGTKSESGWNQYLEVLHPSDEQLQCIANRDLLETMRGEGDQLADTRQVQHWVYFKQIADRQNFRVAVQSLGYQIAFENESPQSDRPFGISVVRMQSMDSSAVDETVIELFRLAKSNGGNYDGWECQLRTEAAGKPKFRWKFW